MTLRASASRFGHEHGRDPHGSALYSSVGPAPFGVANEARDTWDPVGIRHEVRVGHKIEWENGVQPARTVNGVWQNIGVSCDFLTKIHAVLTLQSGAVRGLGQRSPHHHGRRGELAYFVPHFAVFAPSRYYESALVSLTGRSMEACYETEGNGDVAAGGACAASTANGQEQDVTWDDPRSTQNCLTREVYFNQTTVVNPGGPTTWHTDPFGGHASTTAFPGSVRQMIAAVDNRRAFPLESQAFGATRSYGGNGVHAPN